MAEDLFSRCVVAIGLRNDLFDLLRHQTTNGGSMLCRDDLRAANRHLVELNREISPGHARILRRGRQEKANGGGGGIRTHGTVSRTAVFKTAALNRSATPPWNAEIRKREAEISR
jgi:hypothetical protein